MADGRRSRIGALGEATSSRNQVMTYPCDVGILKPSPPTMLKVAYVHAQPEPTLNLPSAYPQPTASQEEPTEAHGTVTRHGG